MTHVSCRLNAKNGDHQLRNPTLGSREWATFTFFIGIKPNYSRELGEVELKLL